MPELYYHGGEHPLTVMRPAPLCFVQERAIAENYAESYGRLAEATSGPWLTVAELQCKRTQIYSGAALATVLEISPAKELDCSDWEAVYNHACALEKAGYDSMLLQGVIDYTGTVGGVRKTGAYDQWWVWNPAAVVLRDCVDLYRATNGVSP